MNIIRTIKRKAKRQERQVINIWGTEGRENFSPKS